MKSAGKRLTALQVKDAKMVCLTDQRTHVGVSKRRRNVLKSWFTSASEVFGSSLHQTTSQLRTESKMSWHVFNANNPKGASGSEQDRGHGPDPGPSPGPGRGRGRGTTSGQPYFRGKCRTCGVTGHKAQNCPDSDRRQTQQEFNEQKPFQLPRDAPPATPDSDRPSDAQPAVTNKHEPSQPPSYASAMLDTDRPSDAQPAAPNQWATPGTVSNTSHPSEQLVIQTAIDNRDTSGELLSVLRKKGYQTDVAQIGRPSSVLTNFLSIEQRPTTLFVYDIAFIRESGKDDNDKTVYFTRKFDKEGLFTALRQRPGYERLNTQFNWVTDYTNIWSTTPLFHDLNYMVVPAAEDQLAGTNLDSKRDITAERATITFSRAINLQKTIGQLYGDSNGQTKGDENSALLQRGLNAIVSKHASEKAKLPQSRVRQVGANKFYDRDTGFALDDGKNIIGALHGFFISVRPGAQQLLVNINLRCSPFLAGGRRIEELVQEWSARRAASILKGTKVRLIGPASVNHQHEGVEFITDILANGDVNVGHRYPATPRLFQANAMQTFASSPWRQPLSSEETSTMIEHALKLPSKHVQELTQKAVRMFGFDDPQTTASLLKYFGMVVNKELMEIPCRFLQAPGIEYKKHVNPVDASWNLRDQKVREPRNGRTLLVIVLARAMNSKYFKPLSASFEKILKAALESMGIRAQVQQHQILQVLDASDNVSEPVLRRELNRIVPSQVRNNTSVVVVIPRRSYDLYSVIKRVADLSLGIQTTCVAANNLKKVDDYDRALQKVQKDAALNKAIQHFANVGLKLNLKGDGHNHAISRSNISELYEPHSSNVELQKAKCDTIVIGADVTHPMGHCAPSCPSVAAVVGSVDDDFAKFPGSMRLQRSKTEVILELHDMVMERLLDWADKHDSNLPGSMPFYRDGVSESQFDSIRTNEIEALQQAYDKADNFIRKQKGEEARNGCYPFKLTFIVVGKRHNTRFFPKPEEPKNEKPKDDKPKDDKPKDDKPRNDKLKDESPQVQKPKVYIDSISNGNVKPGLLVDQVITHPYIMDFYLQSHQPIKGTGRSAHYFVLRNNMALSSDSLHKITHAFCYNYARATKGVSYCGPAYYADRLCDRGRAYVRDWLIGNNRFGPSRGSHVGESAEDYQDFVANELQISPYYRPDQTSHKYGQSRKNPWHPNLDSIMFYL